MDRERNGRRRCRRRYQVQKVFQHRSQLRQEGQIGSSPEESTPQSSERNRLHETPYEEGQEGEGPETMNALTISTFHRLSRTQQAEPAPYHLPPALPRGRTPSVGEGPSPRKLFAKGRPGAAFLPREDIPQRVKAEHRKSRMKLPQRPNEPWSFQLPLKGVR